MTGAKDMARQAAQSRAGSGTYDKRVSSFTVPRRRIHEMSGLFAHSMNDATLMPLHSRMNQYRKDDS